MTTNQYFNEEIYLANNQEVVKAVAEGKYASGHDEYAEVGQFVERNGVIFNGTSRNDTIQASGQKSSVIGVGVETAKVGSRLINAETTSNGDVIARIEDGENLKLVQIESSIPGTNTLVSTEYEELTPVIPSEPVFGTLGGDTLVVNKSNQLIFAGAGDDLIDAIASTGNNRIYGGNGNNTFILGCRPLISFFKATLTLDSAKT
jgi:Ca2+-binding RTX toxin-like protein